MAALIYLWDVDGRPMAEYYSAAVRSMSESWTGFVFGAVDPAASITLDKIPGAFWPQALLVRIFGFHSWTVILPQAVWALLTVLALYRAVRRHSGPAAGLSAAAAMALTPVAAALAHAQWPDALLTLLLVLAADASLRAVTTGRRRSLILAAVWVGLAVQAKMLAAWGVLPALAVAYLVAGPARPPRRAGHVALAGMVTLAVSSAWIALVWVTPGTHRPYVDATTDDNPIEMVVDYNFADRFSEAGSRSAGSLAHRTGLADSLFGWLAPQVMWLFPVAALALVVGLARRGRAPRTDLERAGLILWGIWLVTYGTVFSVAQVNHAAYVVILAPAVAALAGVGLARFGRAYREGDRWWPLLPAAVAATVAWSVAVTRRTPDFLPWLAPLTVVLGVLAVAALVLARLLPGPPGRARSAAVTAGALAVLVAPAAWTVATMDQRYSGLSSNPAAGPFGAGMEYVDAPPEVLRQLRQLADEYRKPQYRQQLYSTAVLPEPDRAILRFVRAHAGDRRYLLAASQATWAANAVSATGYSVLPMGGFTGRIPFPAHDRFLRLIDEGDLRYVLVVRTSLLGSGTTTAPDSVASDNVIWVERHCVLVEPGEYGTVNPPAAPDGSAPPDMTTRTLYDCAS